MAHSYFFHRHMEYHQIPTDLRRAQSALRRLIFQDWTTGLVVDGEYIAGKPDNLLEQNVTTDMDSDK